MSQLAEAIMNRRETLILYKATVDFANIAADAGADEQTVTIPGVALGDAVIGVGMGVDPGKTLLWGRVTAANTVKLVLFNKTGGALNVGSTTVYIWILKFTTT